MRSFSQRFLILLTPGVRVLLGLLAVMYVTAMIGKLSDAFDLYAWLTLSGPTFWSGQIWRVVTYALLPAGILDFLMNGIALVMLGGMLERHWSRRELWVFCAVAVLGAGFVKVFLRGSNPQPLTGAVPLVFGLLVAWGFLWGRETVCLVPFGEMTVWKLVVVAGAISLLIMFFTAGPVATIIMTAGGLTGLIYLWIKLKWLMHRAGSVVHSERIHRLEL